MLICFLIYILLNVGFSSSEESPVNGPIPMDSKTKESHDDLQKAMAAYSNALVAVGEGAIGEIPGGASVTGAIKALYEIDSDDPTEPDSIWRKVKSKVVDFVTSREQEALDNRARKILKKMEEKIKLGYGFTNSSFVDAINYQLDLLPQENEHEPWTDNFALNLVPYVNAIMNMYYIRIDKGDAKRCDFGDYTVELRPKLVDAMKEMIRKFFRLVEGVSGKDKEGATYIFDNITPHYVMTYKIKGKKGSAEFKATLPDKGEYNIVRYCDGMHMNACVNPNDRKVYTFEHEINKIRDNVVEFLFVNVINKTNQFFEQDQCLTGCPCAEPITQKEIVVDWPLNCMEDSNEGCTTPCLKYDWTDTWCLTPDDWQGWEDDCKPVDIRCCMVLPHDTEARRKSRSFADRCFLTKKKKKAKKNKNKKIKKIKN